MKKGFTLIEIIVVITLISIIGVSSVIGIIKITERKKEELKEDYQEKVHLASNLFFEKNNNSNLYNIVFKYKETAYIKVGDLVDTGLINSKLYNPYLDKISEQTKNECISIYLDEDDQFKIEYPLINKNIECKNKLITEEKKEAIIIIEDNFIEIPTTYSLLEKLRSKMNNNECFNKEECFQKIKDDYLSNEYIKNNLKYSLYDVITDEKIKVDINDWEIISSFDENTKKIKVTPIIKENSELYQTYSIYNDDINVSILLSDTTGPVIVDDKDYLLFDDKEEIINLKYNFMFHYLNINNEKNLIKFDNYDGFSIWLPNYIYEDDINIINEDDVSRDNLKEFIDTNGISSYYFIDYKISAVPPIYANYWGPTVLNIYEIKDRTWNYIDYLEIINNETTGKNIEDFQLCEIKNNEITSNCHDDMDLGSGAVRVGNYLMKIKVCDDFSNCFETKVDIQVVDNNPENNVNNFVDWNWDRPWLCNNGLWPCEERKLKPNVNVCDDDCILEKMKQNSSAWHDTTDTSIRNALHEANLNLAANLSYKTSYNSSEGKYYNNNTGKALYTIK